MTQRVEFTLYLKTCHVLVEDADVLEYVGALQSLPGPSHVVVKMVTDEPEGAKVSL